MASVLGMDNIKLFVCCHKESDVHKHPLLAPVQVGTALADTRFEGFLYDDAGENISAKNPYYCERTTTAFSITGAIFIQILMPNGRT